MKTVKFRATSGAQFSSKKVKEYGSELLRIVKDNGGEITPRQIVEEASDPASPLNDYFQWNDDLAASNWRTQQARNLINCIEVEIEYCGEKVWCPVLESYKTVIVEDHAGEEKERTLRVYVATERVVKDKDVRNQLISEALRLLNAAVSHIIKIAYLTQAPEKRSRLQNLAKQMEGILAEVQEILSRRKKSA